jgi:acyl-CoA reductase-like NAD-dependent aldehyde dehydrogenase
MTATSAQTTQPVRVRSLIAGEWADGEAEVLTRANPATGHTATTVPLCSTAQLDRAVAAASVAKRTWAATPPDARARQVTKLHTLLLENRSRLARAITIDMGKTLRHSLEEIDVAARALEEAVIGATRQQGELVPSTGDENTKRVIVTHVPIGVVAVITTWNFPVGIAMEQLPPALASGNPVVWKPSEVTPLSSYMVADLLHGAGFPAGVVSVLHGGTKLGAQLVAHAQVDMVSFVGSISTGEQITRLAGVKPLLLELGGNGPLVVMDDADLDKAVSATIASAFYVGGQVCTAAERLLVQSAVHDEFVARLLERIRDVKAGDPFQDDSYLGPMALPSVIEKTSAHIHDAVERGARVVSGGVPEGSYFPPTVLVDVAPEMEIAQEETFGPVAPIIRFETPKEAIRIANGTRYGLQAAVFTSSLRTAWLMSEGLDCGVVHVNEGTNYWELRAPFGGMKQSGVGRLFGSRNPFTRPKQITFDLAP